MPPFNHNNPPCEIPGCTRPARAKKGGMCASCSQHFYRTGQRPTAGTGQRGPGGPPRLNRICETPRCGRKHCRHGLCMSCSAYEERTGIRPTLPPGERQRYDFRGKPPTPKDQYPPCITPRCARLSLTLTPGLCKACDLYQRAHGGNAPTLPTGQRPPTPRTTPPKKKRQRPRRPLPTAERCSTCGACPCVMPRICERTRREQTLVASLYRRGAA